MRPFWQEENGGTTDGSLHEVVTRKVQSVEPDSWKEYEDSVWADLATDLAKKYTHPNSMRVLS